MDGIQTANSGAPTPGNGNSPPTQSAVPAIPQQATPDIPVSWAAFANIVVLAFFLWIAIGAVCEIVTRNEDYARVVAYEKSRVSCRTPGPTDKDCPKAEKPEDEKKSVEFWIDVASRQVRRYNSLNSLGVPNRCLTASVFASEIGHFWEDCTIVLGMLLEIEEAKRRNVENAKLPTLDISKLHKPENVYHLKAILAPTLLTYSGWPWGFDERPKEPLYFLLVLCSAAIGALIAGLRTSGFSTHRDVALGVGAGFAIYLLLRGGNFIFFSGGTTIDVLNPFTAASAGLLVGLFNDKAFGLLGSAMPATLANASPRAAPNPATSTAKKNAELAQTNALAAATKAHEAILEAMKKAQPDTEAYKALQAMALAALEAKTKAEEAAKAQGEAAKAT